MGEESDNQEKPTVLIKTPSNILNNKFLVYPVILLISYLIGFFSFSLLPFGKSPTTTSSIPSQLSTTGNKLPISISLLTNPIVYEWRGSIEGKLVKVNTDSYTIQDEKGNKIILYFKTTSTGKVDPIFVKLVGKEYKNIKLNDVPIGTTLRGEFYIYNGQSDTPVGTSFEVIK